MGQLPMEWVNALHHPDARSCREWYMGYRDAAVATGPMLVPHYMTLTRYIPVYRRCRDGTSAGFRPHGAIGKILVWGTPPLNNPSHWEPLPRKQLG